jgi:hypothetical protein
VVLDHGAADASAFLPLDGFGHGHAATIGLVVTSTFVHLLTGYLHQL